jgi:hypothetical protein
MMKMRLPLVASRATLVVFVPFANVGCDRAASAIAIAMMRPGLSCRILPSQFPAQKG